MSSSETLPETVGFPGRSLPRLSSRSFSRTSQSYTAIPEVEHEEIAAEEDFVFPESLENEILSRSSVSMPAIPYYRNNTVLAALMGVPGGFAVSEDCRTFSLRSGSFSHLNDPGDVVSEVSNAPSSYRPPRYTLTSSASYASVVMSEHGSVVSLPDAVLEPPVGPYRRLPVVNTKSTVSSSPMHASVPMSPMELPSSVLPNFNRDHMLFTSGLVDPNAISASPSAHDLPADYPNRRIDGSGGSMVLARVGSSSSVMAASAAQGPGGSPLSFGRSASGTGGSGWGAGESLSASAPDLQQLLDDVRYSQVQAVAQGQTGTASGWSWVGTGSGRTPPASYLCGIPVAPRPRPLGLLRGLRMPSEMDLLGDTEQAVAAGARVADLSAPQAPAPMALLATSGSSTSIALATSPSATATATALAVAGPVDPLDERPLDLDADSRVPADPHPTNGPCPPALEAHCAAVGRVPRWAPTHSVSAPERGQDARRPSEVCDGMVEVEVSAGDRRASWGSEDDAGAAVDAETTPACTPWMSAQRMLPTAPAGALTFGLFGSADLSPMEFGVGGRVCSMAAVNVPATALSTQSPLQLSFAVTDDASAHASLLVQ